MLPVSGAEQFIAREAIPGERPMISASGAYCRLVRPAPFSLCGRKRFHRPRARASRWRSARIGGSLHSSSAFSICSAKSASFGYTNSSMNALT